MSRTERPVFPVPGFRHDDGTVSQAPERDMTLRDYFAAAALPWCLAFAVDNAGDVETAVHDAYTIADKMLKARSDA